MPLLQGRTEPAILKTQIDVLTFDLYGTVVANFRELADTLA